MDVLKTKAKLKALKWILLKYGKIEDIQAQEVNKVFSFNLTSTEVHMHDKTLSSRNKQN
jgi:hypothetical protein